ncbi:MAG: hypothetical protein KUG79_00185 [Pseudomonadales bacterium]|nr:hypothetical protein [Pseudomonadales bacterium]
MTKKKSLNITILQYFSILALVTLGAATASFYFGSRQIVLEYRDSVANQLTKNIIEQTTNYLDAPAIQSGVISQLVGSADIIKNQEMLLKYMWQQIKAYPQVQSIFVADTQGNYVQVRSSPRMATRVINRNLDIPIEQWIYRNPDYSEIEIDARKSKKPNFDPRTRPWFLNTGLENKVYWSNVYPFTTAKTPGISASYPVKDKAGTLIAVVGVNLPLESLSSFLAIQEITTNGTAFISNESHELIAYPDPGLLSKLLQNTGLRRMALVYDLPEQYIRDAYDHFRLNKESSFTTVTNSNKYVTKVDPFSGVFPWQVFVIFPEDEILGRVNNVLLQTLVIVAVIFLVSLFFIQLLSRRITKPIQQLSIETAKIKTLDLDEVKQVPSNILEIDSMSQALISTTAGLQSFRKYVPAELVKQLIELGEEASQGGKEAELTLFFTDIEGFTTIAESMHPQDLMIHLSQYFDELSNVVMAGHGTIDKYIGDAIMAFWGAPVEQKNKALNACTTALAFQKKNDELNKNWADLGKPTLNTRIGLHTGRSIVGNVGSEVRINYTVLGDSVNLAARLEGINKLYGTRIIISETTYYEVKQHFFCRQLDVVAVKGKTRGVPIYELICDINLTDTDLHRPMDFYEQYQTAFDAYLNREWQAATNILINLQKQYADDKSIQLLVSRCQYYQNHADELPEDWDGTTTLTAK